MAVDSVRTDSTLSETAPNPASSARLCSRQSADEAAQGGIVRRPRGFRTDTDFRITGFETENPKTEF